MIIRNMKYILFAALIAITLTGCGSSSNSEAPQVNAVGKHPSSPVAWSVAHRQAYSIEYLKDNAMQCRDCHGLDLTGGIAKVNCFAGIPGGNCHAGGHGPRPVPHAMPFTASASHGPAAKADLVYCQTCHGQSGGPGNNPRFNVAIGSLTQGCTASGCHNTNSPTQYRYTSAAHPIAWSGSDHNTAGNLLNACGLCHGTNLLGGTGQSCKGCHTSMTPGVPPLYGECVSCHAKPPSGSSSAPIGSRAFAHTAHNSVAGLANLCSACHYGAGSGTARHGLRTFINVSTSITPDFAAKTGTGRVNPDLTCTNVSCHGGVTTPAWTTGIIDITSDCTLCHTAGTASQSPQFNSYWSGLHDGQNLHAIHVNKGLPCYDCHDMTVTTNNGGISHFSHMGSPIFDLDPSLTIRRQVNYNGVSCSPIVNPVVDPVTGFRFQFTSCHATETW